MSVDVTTAPAPVRAVRSLQSAMTARGAAVLVAVVSTLLVFLTWWLFVDTALGQQLEQIAYEGAMFGQGKLWMMARRILSLVSISYIVLGLAVSIGIAVVRRRWWLAVQIAVLVVGANVTTRVLKYVVLDRENLIGGRDWENSLPSGHTTVAATVSASLLLAVPRRWRPVVAVLGGGYAAATGVSTLIGQWHRPSDVVAAMLVVLAWTAAVCALTPASARDRTDHSPGTRSAVTLMLVAAPVGGVVAMVAAAYIAPWSWQMTETTEVIAYLGAVAGVLAATAATFATALLVRQATARPRT